MTSAVFDRKSVVLASFICIIELGLNNNGLTEFEREFSAKALSDGESIILMMS